MEYMVLKLSTAWGHFNCKKKKNLQAPHSMDLIYELNSTIQVSDLFMYLGTIIMYLCISL